MDSVEPQAPYQVEKRMQSKTFFALVMLEVKMLQVLGEFPERIQISM